MRAKKSLGQNFLRDEGVIDRIVASLDLSKGDMVLEIGPGRGALTNRLVETGATVLAIEIDRDLVPTLRTQFHFHPNFSVVEADVLTTDLAELLTSIVPVKTKVVGNLPYYISTAILQKLAAERALFSRIVLMLQREVAERITAVPGNSERGFLTVMTESAFETQRLFDVAPTAFSPVPKVWSTVVALTPKPPAVGDEPGFRAIVSGGFAQKRKTILNNLKNRMPNAASVLSTAAIAPMRRAETLTLPEWVRLYNTLEKKDRAPK